MFENDLHLLNKLKNNDELAFKLIYNKFYPRLFYFILEFVKFNDIAENIVQDTFVTLWNKRHELKAGSNLNAYLFTVAKNNCLYKLRDQRYKQQLFADSPISEMELSMNLETLDGFDSNSFIFDEIESLIQQTLDELPPQCKNVFVLSRFENKKNREIAEELGISVKVVEKHITKALKRFRLALKDYLPLVAYLFIP